MAIDFPNSPAVNDTFTAGGSTWLWNGSAWVSVGSAVNNFGNVAVSGQTTVAADSSSDTLTLASTDLAVTTDATTDTVTLTLATVNSNVGSFGTSIDIPVVTVNGKGLVTAVSTLAVRVGSTSQTGVLQLTDSIASTSTTTAATPASVKSAYDLANAALARSGGTMTGSITLRAGTATAGTAPIYLTSGTNLTAAAAGAVEWNGTNLFITQTTGPTRKTVAFTDSNITGTAANVTGTVAVANGGTGQTTYANGELLIGNGTGLAKTTLTGTTDQVIVTNGAGTVTLSLPQSINTTSTPTFATLTLNQATGPQLSLNGGTSNWIQFIGNGINPPAFTTRSTGTKLVLFPNIGAAAVDYALGINANTLWFSVPTSTQLFNWYAGTTSIMTLSGSGTLTATTFAGSGASLTSIPAGQLSGFVAVANGGTGFTSYTNGQLLIGNTTGNTLARSTLTGTANQVVVTNGAGSITLSLPQDIHSGASPSFAGATVSGTFTHNGVTHVPTSHAATAPSSPVTGQEWFNSTTNRLQMWTGSTWRIIGGSWPRIHCRHSATFSVSGIGTHPWNHEDEKVDITHDTVTNNGQFTIPTGMGGIYLVSWSTVCDSNVDTTGRITWVDINTADTSAPTSDTGRRYGQATIQNYTGSIANRSLQNSVYITVAPGDVVRLKYSGPTGPFNWGIANRRDIIMFSMIMIQHNP